jgi:hypothetical protein
MGMRLLMRIARTKPFVDSLDLPKDSKDKTSLFWPTDCNPDTVSTFLPFSFLFLFLTQTQGL